MVAGGAASLGAGVADGVASVRAGVAGVWASVTWMWHGISSNGEKSSGGCSVRISSNGERSSGGCNVRITSNGGRSLSSDDSAWSGLWRLLVMVAIGTGIRERRWVVLGGLSCQ